MVGDSGVGPVSVLVHCDGCRRTWHDGEPEDAVHMRTFPFCPYERSLWPVFAAVVVGVVILEILLFVFRVPM